MKYDLKLNKEYKYKEICEILNQPVKTGRSRVLQLNNWKNYFSWNNPTTQKFIITEIYNNIDELEMKTAGGAREGSGRKIKLEKEFNCVFECFIRDAVKKNSYYRRFMNFDEVYFNNNQIYKFFGLYKDLYAGQDDENVDQEKYILIADKIREKARSLIYSKIKKKAKDGEIIFGESIIAYKKKQTFKYQSPKNGEYKEEWLDKWNQYQEEFINNNRLGFLKNVIDEKRWDEMIDYISSKFEGYELVKKYYKIKFNLDNIFFHKYDEYKECRNKFNELIVKEVYDYFLKKEKIKYEETLLFEDEEEFNEKKVMKPYRYILDNYIKL